MSALQPRRRARRATSPPAQRQQLEAALEVALSVVEAAVALLDAMDGDADLEPACEDEGYDSDSEPDADGEPTLGSREGGAGGTLWATQDADCPPFECEPDGRTPTDIRAARARCAKGGREPMLLCASALLDPDDAPDPLQLPRYGYECAR